MSLSNPKEPLKEALQLFYDSALFLCAVSAAEAGCGRHQFVNIGAGRLNLPVAEGVIDKFTCLALVKLFVGNDGGQLFFLFLCHIAVPFGQHVFHVVDAGNEGLNQCLFTAQLGAGINGFLNRDQNLFVCPVRIIGCFSSFCALFSDKLRFFWVLCEISREHLRRSGITTRQNAENPPYVHTKSNVCHFCVLFLKKALDFFLPR